MTAAGQLVPIVFLPRFTSFIGPGITYRTHPIRVSDYESLQLSIYRGALNGTSATFGFKFLESTHRETWTDIDGFEGGTDPGYDTEQLVEFSFTKRWFRVGLVMGGTQSAVTCWAQGFLVKREP